MKMVEIRTEDKSSSRWFNELIEKYKLNKNNQIHSAVVMWEYGGKLWNAKLNCGENELRGFRMILDHQIDREMMKSYIEENFEITDEPAVDGQ